MVPYTLTLTRELISEVDAVRGGKSRSGWVREAIEEKLPRSAGEKRGALDGDGI